MTYDLHGSWDSSIGINAPLYAGANDVTEIQKQLNVDSCIKYWISEGASSEKLILGVPLYGRSFTLSNPDLTTPGSPHSGPGLGGSYSNEPGNLGFNEICEQLSSWTRVWDATQRVPYAYNGNQWVGYDDVESLTIKSNYIKKMKLGGAMVWSVETDDFKGFCGHGNFPLIRTLYNVVIGNTPIPTPSVTSSTNPTTSSKPGENLPNTTLTNEPPETNFVCTANGNFRDPEKCNIFYVCNNSHLYTFTCPEGLNYDILTNTCNWKSDVIC